VLAATAALSLAACGGSGKKTASSSSTESPTTAQSSAAYTISATNVPGVGTVLVNGAGRTLYLLTSEKGGKLTCTDDNGCTKVWPDTELPSGVTQAIAGSGIQSSLLGTVKSASGSLYVSYAGWPLYEYSGDPGAGTANGEGIVSFGGTWYTLTPAGTQVTSKTALGSTSTSGANGY
jgi:predicted lipoprotein with Yx(FWY)xxD motif